MSTYDMPVDSYEALMDFVEQWFKKDEPQQESAKQEQE